MAVYILLILLVLLLFAYRPKGKNSLILTCALLFVISAFRGYSVGTDTIHYVDIFNTITTRAHYKVFELVWYYLNYLIYQSGLSVRYVLIISSAIIIYSFYKGIAFSSKNYLLSVLLFILFFYYFESMNITRQYMAIAIVFCSVCSFKEHATFRDWILYYAITCFAITCHTSAVIALFIPLLYYIPLNRNLSLWLIVASIFVGMFPLQNIIQSYNFLFISEAYNHYFDDFSSVGITGTRLLMNAYIIFVIFSAPNSFNRFDKLMVIGICLQNAFPYPIVIRLFSYLIVFSIISIPNRYSYNRQSLFLLATLLYGFIKLSVFFGSNVAGVVPYSFE